MRKIVLSVFASLLFCLGAAAQVLKVSGTVADQSGQPVIGATVAVAGTTEATITDVNGDYQLKASADATLEVSYIGMKTALVEVAGRTLVNVTLQPGSTQIEDVIVVAYGTARKESFTGSAATVSSDDLAKKQVSTVTQALAGVVPGIQSTTSSGQPGSNATIYVRGVGSINGTQTPLYIVDGMPYDGSISSINPADIESVSVLKDAVSTSLYGSRASNGVIVITTKSGQKGKSKVTFDAKIGVESRLVGEYDIMKDPAEYITTLWGAMKMQNGGDGLAAAQKLASSIGYNPFIATGDVWNLTSTDSETGEVTNYTVDKIIDENGQLLSTQRRYTDDWAKEAFRAGKRTEYTLGIEGGNNLAQHFMSIGYLTDEGIIRGTDYERITGRMNLSHKVNKYIDLNGSLSYARGEQNLQYASGTAYTNTFFFSQTLAPIYPVYAYDAEGKLILDEDGDKIYDWGDGTYGVRAYSPNQNPLATDDANVNQSVTDQVSARGSVNVHILDGLEFQANLGYDMHNGIQTVHQSGQFGDGKQAGGRTYKYNTGNTTLTSNQLLTYNKSIGNNNFEFLLGHESYQYDYRYQMAHKSKFFVTEGNVEFDNAIKMESISSYTDKETMESYFASLNYNYADKYYLSGSLRTDGSSRFAPKNRWGTFGSVGANWRISQEEFLKDVEWLDNLALKASWGTVGNNGIGNLYAYRTQYAVNNANGEFSVSKVYFGNPDLTWEVSENYNAGVTASLFGGLLTVDFEVYKKYTDKMLYNMPQPPSSGISSIPMNALSMQNIGYDFDVAITPIKTRNALLSIRFTGGHYNNTVLNLPESKKANGITSGNQRIMEGYPLYSYYYYKNAGVDPETGKALWYADQEVLDDEGNPTGAIEQIKVDNYEKASKYDLGTALPDFIGGVILNFQYKNFDFSAGANYQLGGLTYDSLYASAMHTGRQVGQNWHRDALRAWTSENKNTDVPVLDGDQNANIFSDRFLVDASYFNLNNITVGYTLPSKLTHALNIQKVRFYVVADNVMLLTNRKGLDPRQSLSGSTGYNYSAIRTVSAGVSLNF